MKQVQFVRSELLTAIGVKHGWFMRYGGVSSGAFESLNGKKVSGDSDLYVDENRARAAVSLGESPARLAHIVHSFEDNILMADSPGEFTGYDAITTSTKGLLLSQTTADCGSVIIATKNASIVSVVHGSWHTLSAQIIRKTVAKMKQHTDSELIAGIGPMICRNCYEFGVEARDIFNAKYLKSNNKKYLVDLTQMITDQLQGGGITQIDNVNICTLEDERFFSHRRNGVSGGRFITLAAA